MKKRTQCNWCFCNLEKNKKYYCTNCETYCKRECCACHKPYPNLRFFVKDEKRCNSCQTRYITQLNKRKQYSLENLARKRKKFHRRQNSLKTSAERSQEPQECHQQKVV